MRRRDFIVAGLRRVLLASSGGLLLAVGAAGCGGDVKEQDDCKANVSSTLVSDRLVQTSVRRIDLVLAIDNSRSMADKQQLLALAVPDLVEGLVNPACVNPGTGEVTSQPSGPLEACPSGTRRAFDPVVDIHIGIVSSSLGGHGSDACAANTVAKQSNDDKGHLIARLDPALPEQVETYQDLKFLAWDPQQELQPPGESDVNADSPADPNASALVPSLRDMVIGVGQIGCGYESQLESWYRFLVDPTPPASLQLNQDGQVFPDGIDEQLLTQRKHFLRPDSLLAIVMLSDENDCSIKEVSQFYMAAQQKAENGQPYRLPKARAACEADPNDVCCFSCAQKGPTDNSGAPECPADPTCKTADGKTAFHDELNDNINVRCWDQKRRFGIDFLYPTSRYVDVLRSQTVVSRNGEVVANPLFSDLDPGDSISTIRTSNLVLLAGIVGVPWQDIARTNGSGIPDLQAGLDVDGKPRGGFKSADEMHALLPGKDYSTWDLVLGSPEKYPAPEALPKDPLMLEDVTARTGQNPITGEPLVTSDTPLANKINGHEWDIPSRDDLQYACIFPIVEVDPVTGQISPAKRDCSVAGLASCDCEDEDNDSPLCDINPSTGKRTDQARSKAYPGLRELEVLRDVGSQGVVASVCPAQLTNLDERDFGYRPAIASILDRLAVSTLGRCFGRELPLIESGQVECLIIEARAGGSCNCASPGRIPVEPDHQGAVKAIQDDDPDAPFDCFCEVPQLENTAPAGGAKACLANYNQPGYDLCACQYTPAGVPVMTGDQAVNGWCYVDPGSGVGSSGIVENCPSGEQRIIRFVGAGEAASGATLFITCNLGEEHAANPECP